MSLKQKAITGMSWTLFQQFGVSGISFLVQIVLARLISPEEFGIYGLLLIFNAIGNSISDSGMGQSIIRSDNLKEDDYGTIFITNIGVSIILYLLIVALGPFIADFYDKPIISELIWVYSLSIILTSFSSIQIFKLSKSLNFKKQAMIQIPSIFIAGIVGIILGYLGYGVWALVIMQLVQNFVLSIQYWFFSGWRPQLIFNKEKLKRHFDFGYKLTLAGLIETVFTNIYPMVIGKFYTTAAVGFYTRADTLQKFPVKSLMTSLSKVTYPIFAEVKHDNVRLKNAYKKLMQTVLFIMAPLMIYLILNAKQIIVLLLSEEWLPAVPFFQLLCITGILLPMNAYNVNVLKVKGRSDLVIKAQVIKKSILAISLIITVGISVEAIIIGQVITSVINLLINQYFSGKFIKYNTFHQLKDALRIIVPTIVTGLIVYLILSKLFSNDFHNFIFIVLSFLIFTSIYISIQYVLNKKTMNELRLLLMNFKKNKN